MTHFVRVSYFGWNWAGSHPSSGQGVVDDRGRAVGPRDGGAGGNVGDEEQRVGGVSVLDLRSVESEIFRDPGLGGFGQGLGPSIAPSWVKQRG